MVLTPTHAKLRGAALVAVLALAAILRFAGLAYEVRHPQHYDDRVFVNNVIAMLAAGDADHRYYEYPGLFFYLLALPVALAQPERLDDPGAYLAARILVAVFGVASVGLIYRLGSRLAGPGLGLTAALLLAVSPHEVAAAHTNRPDVVLQTLTLAGYLSLLSLGRDWRGDVRFGLWLGAGTAIKFTGFLLYPSYLLARLRTPSPRLARVVAVAAVASLVVLAVTPYALVHPEAYMGGVSHQMGAHYQEPVTASSYLENLGAYGRWLVRPFGVPAVALAVLGAAFALRGGQAGWLAILVHLPLTVLVMSSAGIVVPRFLIPALGGFWLAAGLGVRTLSRGNTLAAALLALLAAAAPFLESLDRVRPLLRPSPRDAALDWIEANLPTGSRILETRADALSELRARLIGADPRRFELLFRFSAQGGLPLLAPHMDLAITGPGGGVRWSQELRTVFRGESDGEAHFELKVPRSGARPRYMPLEAKGLKLDASTRNGSLDALRDRDRATAWSTALPVALGDWIEASWVDPLPLARVELWVAGRPSREPDLQLLTRGTDGMYREVLAVAAREPVARQLEAGRPASQLFLLNPQPVTGIRILVADAPPEPWSVAELEFSVRVPAAIRQEPEGP